MTGKTKQCIARVYNGPYLIVCIITMGMLFVPGAKLEAGNNPPSGISQDIRKVRSLFDLREFDQAAEMADSLINFIQAGGESGSSDLATLHFLRGKSLKFALRQEEGLRELEKALELFEASGQTSVYEYCETLYFLGRHYLFIEGNPYEAKKWFEAAVRHAEDLQPAPIEEETLARYFHFLGQATSAAGEHRQAIRFFQRAVSIRKKILGPDNYFTGTSLHSLGNAYFYTGEDSLALELYEQALEVFTRLDYKSKIESCLNNIAVCYDGLGNYEKALEFYEQALQLQQKIYGPGNLRVMITYLNKAIVEGNRSNWQSSLQLLGKALSMAERIGPEAETYRAKIQQEFALTFLRKGEPEKALSWIDQSLTTLTGKSQETLTKSPGAPLANLDDRLLKESLAFKGELLVNHPELMENKSEALKMAVDIFNSYNEVLKSIQRRLSNDADKLYLNKEGVNSFSFGVEAAWDLMQQTNSAEYGWEGFLFMEHSRAQLLLESVARSRARFVGGLPPEVLKKEAALAQRMAQYRNELRAPHPEKGLNLELINLELKANALRDSIEAAHPAYKRMASQSALPPLAELRNLILDRETCLIEYFMSDSVVFMALMTTDTFLLLRHTLPQSFEEQAERFSHLCAHPIESASERMEFLESGSFLYEQLLGHAAIEKHLKQRVILIPDGILNRIPFEVLLTEKPRSNLREYREMPLLLFSHTLSYGNSVRLLVEQALLKDRAHNGKCLGFAWATHLDVPDEMISTTRNETWGKLPGTGKELKSISELIGGDYYFASKARESTFKTHANQFGILHLALHGKARNDEPFFVFPVDNDGEEDGILHLNEMYGLRLNAELAVLSSCESGHGKLEAGEGVLSMARGFAFAGIPSVVTNLWEVEDRSAVVIMSEFYTRLQAGMRVDEALNEAKRAYLHNSGNNLASPFFWASFISIGETGKIERLEVRESSKGSPWMIVLSGIILFGLISFWITRKQP